MITSARGKALLEVCDPECEPGDWDDSSSSVSSAVVLGDGMVYTRWKKPQSEETEDEAGLYLWSCTDATDCEPDEGTRIRSYPGRIYDPASAVAPYKDGLVVASHVRSTYGSEKTEGKGGLRLHVCDEPTCADPRTIEPPGEIAAGAFLDIAVSPEGGFTVAAFDASYGALKVVSCADAECAQPEVSEIFGRRFREEYEGGLQDRFGARIEYRPDGTPVLAYRDIPDGTVRVADCHDTACADFTGRPLTGPGWERPLPGLAVDSLGNPQLATFDLAEGHLELISCLDGGCADTVRTPLARTAGAPMLSVLALDGEDRPHLVWADVEGDGFSSEVDTRYARCTEPLCGAGQAAQTP